VVSARKLCCESNPIVHLAFPLQWLSYPSSSLLSVLSFCLCLTRQRFTESEGSLHCAEIPSTGLFFFWCNSPRWSRASSFTSFLDHTQWSTTVGRTLYERSAPSQRSLTYTTQHTTEWRPCTGGIRTHNPSNGTAAHPCLRPRGHWDRHYGRYSEQYESSPYPPIRLFLEQFWCFPCNYTYSPVRATCLIHLILIHLMTAFGGVKGMKPLIMHIFLVKICC